MRSIHNQPESNSFNRLRVLIFGPSMVRSGQSPKEC